MEAQANPDGGAAIRLRLIALFCVVSALGLCGLASFYGFLAAGAPGLSSLSETARQQDRASLGLSAAIFLAAAAGFGYCAWAAARERRWVPSILRSVGWIWLLTGVLLLLLTIGMLDGMIRTAFGEAGMPPEVAGVAKLGVIGIVSIAGILLPGVLLLLCSGTALRAFVARSSASGSWIDGVPEPVLGLSFAMGLAALMVLPTLFTARLPVGPRVVSGFGAVAIGLGLFSLLAWCAYATFKLRPAGWWLTLLLIVGLGISALWTLRGMSVMQLLRAMGYPEQSIAALSGMGSGWLVGCTIGVTLAGVGQLLWVRRYFGARP